MATVINRETGVILFSVHTPDYPETDWAINPDGLDNVMDIPVYYRVVTGNTVREATKTEKAIIDAARLPGLKVVKRNEFEQRRLEAGHMLNLSDDEKYDQAIAAIEAAKTIEELNGVKI